MDLDLNLTLQQENFTLDANIRVKDQAAGLFGPSGAGKSTLLHLISGLKKPRQGKISLKGRTLCDTEKGIFIPPEDRNIGVVFQDTRLFPHLNVKKNIFFGAKKNADPAFVKNVIDTLDIGHLLKRGPENLSGGEQQRVAIARALLRKPELLLLDEPFSGIDVQFRSSLLPFINRVRQRFNCPMIIISHNLPDILSLTNALIIIQNGKILGYGDCSDLAFDPNCSGLIKHSGIYATFDAKVNLIDKPNGIISFCTMGSDQLVKAPYKEGVLRDMLVRARVRPEDIILAKEPADFLTAQNQIKATVKRIQESDDEVLLELDAGFKILSGITRKAARRYEIAEGKKIWVIFKSLAVEYFVP